MSKEIDREETVGHLERNIDYIVRSISERRKWLFWVAVIVFALWIAAAVREVTMLLLLAYTIALLIDPVVTSLERRRVSRSVSIIALCLLVIATIVALLGIAIPLILGEYGAFVAALPSYLEVLSLRFGGAVERWVGVGGREGVEQLIEKAKSSLSMLGVEQLRQVSQAVGQTLLKGYSFTLTIFNLVLLPFFVYYIARDLRPFHRSVGGFLPRDVRRDVAHVGKEILSCVYAFVRGQLTVALLLAVLYSVALAVVGLPWALVVGLFSGALSVVPYLGVGIGLVLSTIITLVTSDAAFPQLFYVWGAMGAVQIIDGSLITPRIVGESVGIHPLVVMLALIVGGQLFGLLGLIIAVPAAAAVRVLFRHILAELEGDPA